ncbi:hypothetical protein AURDEDRAFT_114864 [Auricularia subglabra TFB-10046 SS5]|nr:hypothetical protein AURDEDRAFT_114864 [Auricularia subglabra TFB-10046 SS5]
MTGPDSFTLSTTAPTDLWRKPGHPPTNRDNDVRKTVPVPLASFKRLRATIHADWARQYDQGGLLIIAPSGGNQFWVKCGIELFDGIPYVSCVVADAGADLSLAPGLVKDSKVTLELATAGGNLWLYYIAEDGSRVPLREVTWFFTKGDDIVADVGVYTCRPTTAENGGKEDELVVHFDNYELEHGQATA